MSRYKKNFLITVGSIIGFIVLFVFCFFYFKNLISHTPIVTFQFYQLVIMVISAILTLTAVAVALFKDQMYSWFKYAELSILNRDPNFISENIIEEKSNSSQNSAQTPVAESYECVLHILNKGNKLAEGCTIQLTHLKQTGDGIAHESVLDTSNCLPLTWNNSSKDEILIYPKSKGIVSVVKMNLDAKGVPGSEGNAQSIPAILSIGGINVKTPDRSNSTWTATFVLCSKQTNLFEYKLEIIWNGSWKSRLTEIKQNLSIKPI